LTCINGLSPVGTLDAGFDCGLFSFADDGTVPASPELSQWAPRGARPRQYSPDCTTHTGQTWRFTGLATLLIHQGADGITTGSRPRRALPNLSAKATSALDARSICLMTQGKKRAARLGRRPERRHRTGSPRRFVVDALCGGCDVPNCGARAPIGDIADNWSPDMRLAGLVPKQESTGDRTILGKVSKRGNKYLRTLFVQAAHVVLEQRLRTARSFWSLAIPPRHWPTTFA
jgi:hypothetical protein